MTPTTDAHSDADSPTGDEYSPISRTAFWVLSVLAAICAAAALFAGVALDHGSSFVLAALAIVLVSQSYRSALYRNSFGSLVALVSAAAAFATLVQDR